MSKAFFVAISIATSSVYVVCSEKAPFKEKGSLKNFVLSLVAKGAKFLEQREQKSAAQEKVFSREMNANELMTRISHELQNALCIPTCLITLIAQYFAPKNCWEHCLPKGMHLRHPRDIAWSPNGNRLACVSGSALYMCTLKDIDCDSSYIDYSGSMPKASDHIAVICWSPCSQFLALGLYSGIMKIWNVMRSKYVKNFKEHKKSITTVVWSPSGKFIASADKSGTVCIWDVRASFKRLVYTSSATEGSEIISCVWDNDTLLAISRPESSLYYRDQCLNIYKVHEQQCLGTLNWSVLQSAYNSVQERYVKAGSLEKVLVDFFIGKIDWVRSLDWSPNRRSIAMGGYDAIIRVWNDITLNHFFVLKGHKGMVVSIAWSPHGKLLASGGNDEIVNIWDLGSQTCIATCSLEVLRDDLLKAGKAYNALLCRGPIATVAWYPCSSRVTVMTKGNEIDNNSFVFDIYNKTYTTYLSS